MVQRATALHGIGNEAVVCAGGGHGGNMSEQVIGRVRDRVFVVRVATNDKTVAPASLREEARSAAAQVAGNLF